MVERELIAERTIYAIDKDSRGFEIRIMIGKPYEIQSGDWACPVATMGLYGVYPDMHGVDSWQALTLAQRLVEGVLGMFVNGGGKLFTEKDGFEFDVEELFSGRPPQTEPFEPPLTEEEYQAHIGALTPDQLKLIDDHVIAGAPKQFRKVARVAWIAMKATEDEIFRIPDYFFATRVQQLVKQGRLVSQGNLERMRYSEVKLPD